MACSPKQRKLIEDLMEEGAPIPEHPQFDRPDDSMFHSVEAADAYIKANIQYLSRKASMNAFSKRVSAADWGGIPNH
jgi:hypothetical protein